MEHTQTLPDHITENRLADSWAELLKHPADATVVHPNAYRLAFADPEFMLRRDTRGIGQVDIDDRFRVITNRRRLGAKSPRRRARAPPPAFPS